MAGELGVILLAQEEVKARLTTALEEDERMAVGRLRDCGSVARDIYMRLGLTRDLIKGALKTTKYCGLRDAL